MKSETLQFEKIPTQIFPSSRDACRSVADEIADLIRKRDKEGKPVVLGLATGSTPVRLYRELIRLHREDGLSFGNVVTFNLDEYFPITPENAQSYHRFMREQFFDHIDIRTENIHIPDGTLERSDVFEFCRAYEEKIRAIGGIDFQILGIGRTGHIGFNEPGSSRDSRTRLVTLDRMTRQDAAPDFMGEENVPRHAITMGVATILEARRVILMAWGDRKAEIVQRAVEGPVSDHVSASFLQEHPDARFVLDEAAAEELTQKKLPWRVGLCDWTPDLVRRAVVWLSRRTRKSILKLVEEEYNENSLGDLVTEQGTAYNINIRVFNELQHTITGWPGGKPNADDSNRPERANPHPKQVILFSPEPHDDMLFMGGTLNRLVTQGHDVHLVYMTSGSLAVSDEDARKYAEFIVDVEEISEGADQELGKKVIEALQKKGYADIDPPEVRQIKGMIRRGEARAACRVCGVSMDRITFLDLPFYEKGRLRNFELQDEDVELVAGLLDRIKPHQIYTAGDLGDPSSSRRLCLEAVETALGKFRNKPWVKDCYLWMYRSSQHEWPIDEIDMTVPLSPDELLIKTTAIYKHQTQKSQAPAHDDSIRESWQQAEARNRATAQSYDQLGFAEYEAMEAFKRAPLAQGAG